MIVQGAHAIRRGDLPEFQAADGMRRDLFLIERTDPRRPARKSYSLVCGRLPSHYSVDPVNDIQVFAPVYKASSGSTRSMTPYASAQPGRAPCPIRRLRIGTS